MAAGQPTELIIRNGTIITDAGTVQGDLRIRNGLIDEMGERLVAGSSAREIDASGLLVLPGGIDHVAYTREQKLDPGQTVQRHRAGMNNLQVMRPMLYSDGVRTGRITPGLPRVDHLEGAVRRSCRTARWIAEVSRPHTLSRSICWSQGTKQENGCPSWVRIELSAWRQIQISSGC